MFEPMLKEGHEQVVFCTDARTGLRSIIAIHDTTLGPALGGVRMHPYRSEDDALADVLRLSKGMTYKAAAAGVSLGGGKSVIIGDPKTQKSEALLRSHGRFIQTLGGRYIPGIDVGTEQRDMEVLASEVALVSCARGDPSPMTALGVLSAIRGCVAHVFGGADLRSLRVAVQGVGHVGSALVRLLCAEGAEVVVSDVDQARATFVADQWGAELAAADQIIATPCEILAPCAMGGVVNDRTLAQLKCRIVAGAANNVLAERHHGEALHELGILYAPDYYANAGGLIFLEEEMMGHGKAHAERRVRGIADLIKAVLDRATVEDLPTSVVADMLVEERLRAVRGGAAQSGSI